MFLMVRHMENCWNELVSELTKWYDFGISYEKTMILA